MLVAIYSCPTSYSTDKANSNNINLEELGTVYLNMINVNFRASEIFSISSKNGQGLTQWTSVHLGPTIIYNTK